VPLPEELPLVEPLPEELPLVEPLPVELPLLEPLLEDFAPEELDEAEPVAVAEDTVIVAELCAPKPAAPDTSVSDTPNCLPAAAVENGTLISRAVASPLAQTSEPLTAE
jgi:hypothetical protein